MTKFTSNAERRRFDMSTADLNFVSNASKRRFENGIKKDNLLREQAAQRKKEVETNVETNVETSTPFFDAADTWTQVSAVMEALSENERKGDATTKFWLSL